jgi:hypothetical protein
MGHRFSLVSIAALSLAACNRSDEPPHRGAPPPPVKTAAPGACASGGGKIADATSAPLFPPTSGGYCLDPHGGEKTFGEGASLPLDNICTDVFDGECEIYKGFGVRRVVEARYVDGGGTPATIDVHLSKFATTEGAYAMFTKRVVGDGDPADSATPKPIEGGAAAALGLGNAYLWRGLYLAEITYNNEAAAEPAIKAASEKLLPPLVKAMGDKIPGEAALPSAARSLPKEEMIPLGVRFITKDLLGAAGVGAGALGYYRAGDKRFRIASIERADVDQAKDVITTFGKLGGAEKEKHIGEGAVRLMQKDAGAAVEWILARKGKVVIGVGDEARVLKGGMTAEEHAKVSLTKDEKIDRLKKLLAR